MKFGFILVVIILVIWYFCIHKNNVECSDIDDRCYKTIGGNDADIAADILAKLNYTNIMLIKHLRNKYIWKANNNQMGISCAEALMKQYDPDSIVEHDPPSNKNTSYVFQKGERVGFCLREKLSGNNELHNYGVLLFVNFHEFSHLAMAKYDTGHSNEFWRTFKFILIEAEEAGLYKPVNYAKYPVVYCGLVIRYNPYFDDTL